MRQSRCVAPAARLAITLLAAGALLGLPSDAIARPKTFTVNSTADPGSGGCDATECTLREAIVAANGHNGPDKIVFAIPGAGPHTIAPTSALPDISSPLSINGYSQAGSKANTLVEGTNAELKIILSGAAAGGGANGLTFRFGANNSVVRGLVINGFSGDGIVSSDPGLTVQGNFIGTDVTGTTDVGNASDGVLVQALNATIGGPKPKHRNLIGGNNNSGISISGLAGSPASAVIQGNLIGTDTTGGNNLGSLIGIALGSNVTKTTIGGGGQKANVVAFSAAEGILVRPSAGTGNRILRNSIFLNAGPGIDINDDGVTANDDDDLDTGPNNLQNFPVLTLAETAPGTTKVEGTLNSTPRTEFLIQFYVSTSGEIDEGPIFLGQVKVKTNGQGDATFRFRTADGFPDGAPITATATNLKTKDTSEFSAALPLV